MTQENIHNPVSIVGTGPGDPDLLTVRASRIIRSADVILYDCATAKPALSIASETAIIHEVNRQASAGKPSILELIEMYYHEGRKVVRLKVGDPMLFGGEIDECRALKALNIPFEVVAGITAGSSAASSYALPISLKYQSNSVTYIIADEPGADFALFRDASRLLRHGSTIVLYMATKNLENIFRVFVEEGVPETMAVFAVGKSGWPDESSAEGTMRDIVAQIELRQLKEPIIFFLGRHLTKEKHFPVMSACS
ncbi:Uroporphyrin-III C/tetrapyrrole (Corrin/Porphyrin) methyltransferase [Chlorobium phaeobacteroides DSM 266]|uniref:uroporphyrinogen-III C-methyltransferase n=2 Tax=Chlorobium phaeobacteroides TaxID=1096 RepID=A1BDM4_CHLPD|nr:Uroporphyrin-III C/tetrapyrrole (Corrin/Porphyrin) methyltransferase [Chlorobium phaeobacteroides DSM 266]